MQQTLSTSSFKTKILRIIAVLVTLALIAGGIWVLSRMVRRDETFIHNEAFFSEKNDFDVIFLGSSHMLNAVFPMQLYKDYGIVSYNLAYHGAGGKASIKELILANKYHDFKIAVLDMFSASVKRYQLPYIHDMYDYFPFSKTKLEVLDFLNEKEKMEMIFPFSLYHNRLLSEENIFLSFYDFNVKGYEKGAEYRPAVERNQYLRNPNDFRNTDYDESLYDEYKSVILEFVNYCNSNSILPVLVYIPPYSSIPIIKEANLVSKIADDLNVLFYGLGYENVIDTDTDLFNCFLKEKTDYLSVYDNSHLNPSGARKVTDYIGNILRNDFNVPDHRGEAAYAKWDEDYKEYRNYIFGKMRGLNDFDTLLMSCNFADISVKLFTAENVTFDSVEQKLIAQLKDNIEIIPVSGEETDYTLRIAVTDDVTGEMITEKSFNIGSAFHAK